MLLDLDGTVYDADGLVAGATETIQWLRRAGIAVGFATNTTRAPRSALVERLRRLGLDVSHDDLLTAPRAGAAWLRERGVRSLAIHIADPTRVEFDGFDVDEQAPEVVVVGDLGTAWTFDRLNVAFRQVMAGADLVAMQKNRYWQTPDGPTLDAGPFVAALEFATGTVATVVGKPNPAFFATAARMLGVGLQELVMVGDDVRVDVGGALTAGAAGVLVRTGKFRREDLRVEPSPTAVIRSIAELPTLFSAT